MHSNSLQNQILGKCEQLSLSKTYIDYPSAISKLAFDEEFCKSFLKFSILDRHFLLEEIGQYVFLNNEGHYRNELLKPLTYIQETNQLNNVEKLIGDHCKWLFTTLNDIIAFQNADTANMIMRNCKIDIQNFELFENQVDQTGIVLMGVYTNHIGFILQKLLESSKVNIIRKPNTEYSKSPLLGCFYDKVNMIDANQNGGKRLFYALKKKEVIGLYSDFLYPESRALKGFLFGKSVNFSETLVRIIKMTKSVVIPFSISKTIKNNEINLEIRFHKIIKDNVSDSTDLNDLFIKMNLCTELLIRNKPEQWRLWNTLDIRWLN